MVMMTFDLSMTAEDNRKRVGHKKIRFKICQVFVNLGVHTQLTASAIRNTPIGKAVNDECTVP